MALYAPIATIKALNQIEKSTVCICFGYFYMSFVLYMDCIFSTYLVDYAKHECAQYPTFVEKFAFFEFCHSEAILFLRA